MVDEGNVPGSASSVGGSAPMAAAPPLPPPIPMPPVIPAGAPIPPPPVEWQPVAAGTTTRPVPGALGLEYASSVPRVAAYLLDALIVILLAIIPIYVATVAFRGVLIATLVTVVVEAAYFAVGWRSTARGTPGMRAFKLQIGQVDSGQAITGGAALGRWFALTGWMSVGAFVASNLIQLLGLAWAIVLLISVNTNDERRGLHDRWFGTAIVRPIGQSDTGAWITIVLFTAIPLIAILFLIYIGSQVAGILSTVGGPTP